MTMLKPFISKAVITGACGFIGKGLAEYLVEIGIDVVAIDRYPLSGVNCKSFIMDITRSGLLDELLDDKTVLFHMAAHADVADSVNDPRKDFETNLGGLFEILESVRKKRCQLVFPSTASIFDTSNLLPLSEKAIIKPTSPYAAAKAAGEAYCAAYHRSYGLNIKIARMFSVYGPGMFRFAIHDIIKKIQANSEELVILGDGKQIRDYLYIDDAVRGLAMIAAKGEPGEDYNLASGIPTMLKDLAILIARFMEYPNIRMITSGTSFPGDVPRWYADISKIGKIGFAPKVLLKEGLKRTIKWLMAKTEHEK